MTQETTAGVAQATGRRRIVLAEVAGFCVGVQRAIEMARIERRERGGQITALGPIVHNEQVIAGLEGDGIRTSARLEEITGGTVVLSAHGVAPAVVRQARQQGLRILDTTCPFVTKVHRMAKQLIEQGYSLLLVGDPGHTEVRGIIGAVEALGGTVTLISTPEEVRGLRLGKKVGIISQTTQLASVYAAIVAEVCRVVPDVRACNTICGATDALQTAAVKLAHEVDLVIVIGGRKSANTRRLRALCEREGIPAYHIETAEEVDERWLEGKEVIGITAGASTPEWIIEQVARRLNGGKLPIDWRKEASERMRDEG